MTNQEKRRVAFRQAVGVLPLRLQTEALRLSEELQVRCEEFRLRAGYGLRYSIAGNETPMSSAAITPDDLQESLSRATRYSIHSFADSLQYGFVTLEGGHRLGVCGTAVVRDGSISGLRNLSSINLRIASQTVGAVREIASKLLEDGRVKSTLILSPPAWGKTTLLRDLIRIVSGEGIRVGIADERYELSGGAGGIPQFDLGPTTDVICGGTKADAALMLLKTMSPMVLALDEVTALCDVEAVRFAAHCGASVFATAHAEGIEGLHRRALYRELLDCEVFERLVVIDLQEGERKYRVMTLKGEDIC